MSDDRASFTYVGPDQHIRLGGETFPRHREVLVTDAATIAEARAHPEVEEDKGAGRVPVAKPEPAEPAPEASGAPVTAAPPVPTNPKPVRNRKKPAKKA